MKPFDFARRAPAWLAVLALALGAVAAQAQGYPVKPIQMVVPAAAGGSTDLFARKFAQKLERELGGSIVVANKGGGGGSIGTREVARSAPDGYSMLMGTTGNAVINPLTMSLDFDPRTELAPVAVLGFVAFSINTTRSLGVSNVKEFIDLVRKSPGKYSYASNGPAGFIQMITELFDKQAGLKMVAVPYAGGSAMQQDLISGRIQVYFDAFNSALRFHRSGQTKLLATTGATRSPSAPEIPTVSESGMPGYVAETAFVLMVPEHTPKAIVDQLAAASRKVLADKSFEREMQDLGVRVVADSGPAEASRYLHSEFDKWTPVVQSLKAAK